ncbi:MAG: 3-deoxy-7-phosphoheptulonate synthase [Candidatus Latescibacteria bacterium]|jgi:3-deoxy-7-phosphoheptulonate synthase|nr:3-deoxy-7-phosphoheptulonate synthase [Candidatus Latescibacterota bacterium]MDP7447657.1 3-deoxy-7-phosphoheptulonate synthase [Candidatus Latescibacterota bacterium]HJP33319.1 3-deoxy-7-phosphoheptulonate synthase [Candidatus Latescibacterota bacterium]
MQQTTDDLRIADLRPLIPPAILMEELPVTEKASITVSQARDQVNAALAGSDDRLVVVTGPCSIHDPEAAHDYGTRLKKAADRHADDLIVIMRVYFEKPRTTVGWKGLINDPRLDGSFQINEGLRLARGLLLDLCNAGLPVGSEFLDTISPQFIADLVSWGAIGARTTESQVHRELASGLSMPVGFKNGTGGSTQLAIDAIKAARGAHHFLSVTKQGISAIVATTGNDACHVILRGSSQGPNYDQATVDELAGGLQDDGVPHRVMIDFSHGNSEKDHNRQPAVAAAVAAQLADGSDNIFGVMMESHIVEGRQDLVAGKAPTYGQSITDACLSWQTTEQVLDQLAEAVRARRTRK